MTFQDRLDITTSEGVTVSMTIAGIGSRSLAWMLDLLVIGVTLLMLGLVGINTVDTDSLLMLGLLSFAILLVPFSYVVGSETLNGGRTLGKMAAGIKVVRTSGAPVGFGSAVVRGLFAPIDFLVGGVGIVSMFVSKRSQRIGDIAAGTVVVRDRVPAAPLEQPLPVAPADAPRWDVSAVTDEEVGVIRSFLQRAGGLPVGRRRELASQLRSRVSARVGGAIGTLDDEAFLRRVIAEKHRHV
ncbi:MAG: RDD family protein [Acidimicrobiia bacterium]